ncbi:MAG: hypothetical protein AAF961_17515, partial [Planctomycetota bacterium]
MGFSHESLKRRPHLVVKKPMRREPHLFRFGLRQMFFFIAGASFFCALMVNTEGVWPMVIATTSAMVAAHVFGTLIGTRLRDSAADVHDWKATASGCVDGPVRSRQSLDAIRPALPPPTALASRRSRPQRDRWALAAGAGVGFGLGIVVISLTIGDRSTWAGVLLGAVSCSVLGGWFALLATSFGAIAREAWR